MKEKIDVADLTIGMFVADLDRPWLDTPFMLQGFVIESPAEIDQLKQLCKFVWVEHEKSTGDAYQPPPKEQQSQPQRTAPPSPGAQYAEEQNAAGAGLAETIKLIFNAAFGRGTPAHMGKGRAPARDAPDRVRAVDPGGTGQPVGRTSSAITEAELRYLVAETAQAADRGLLVYERYPKRERLLDTIRSWFRRGARLVERRSDEQAARPEEPAPAYPNLTTFEEELPKAQAVHRETAQVFEQAFADIRNNKAPEVQKVQEAVSWMVESVTRNPDGLMWLVRLREWDVTAYDHGLNVSIYLMSFGRHLGLPQGLLQILGAAGMMQDVGKVRLPLELLEKRTPLTAAEHGTLKSHVTHSVEILQTSQGTSQMLIDIVAQHHERLDGSGYPKGLKGEQISMLGAMAGIVDTYAAMTSARPYRKPVTPQHALQQLYAWRGKIFSAELVEKFIQCIGIFPVGGLVELNTEEVAVVVAHNRAKRLKPRIMLILDRDKQPYRKPMMLDLSLDPPTAGGEPYAIARGLQGGAYDVDLHESLSAAEMRS